MPLLRNKKVNKYKSCSLFWTGFFYAVIDEEALIVHGFNGLYNGSFFLRHPYTLILNPGFLVKPIKKKTLQRQAGAFTYFFIFSITASFLLLEIGSLMLLDNSISSALNPIIELTETIYDLWILTKSSVDNNSSREDILLSVL